MVEIHCFSKGASLPPGCTCHSKNLLSASHVSHVSYISNAVGQNGILSRNQFLMYTNLQCIATVIEIRRIYYAWLYGEFLLAHQPMDQQLVSDLGLVGGCLQSQTHKCKIRKDRFKRFLYAANEHFSSVQLLYYNWSSKMHAQSSQGLFHIKCLNFPLV